MFSKSQIMVQAHKMAKTFEGDYRACFALALKEIYRAMKAYKQMKADDTRALETSLRVKFDSDYRNGFTNISLWKNTYEIRETLKDLGFKYNAFAKVWSIETAIASEALEIARKLA